MSYSRVIPRDLFNEANLLKCYGQLALVLDSHQDHDALLVDDHVDAGFQVEQNPDDGSIRLTNLPLHIGGREVRLYRPLNSREPWPLWVEASELDPNAEDFEVFDADGKPSPAFLDLIGAPRG